MNQMLFTNIYIGIGVCGCVMYMYNYLSIALQKHSSLRIEEAQTIQVSKRYRHILDFDSKTLANGVI